APEHLVAQLSVDEIAHVAGHLLLLAWVELGRSHERVVDDHLVVVLASDPRLDRVGDGVVLAIARRSGSEERGDQDGESVSRRDDDRRDDCRAQEFCLL
ncbi:hypothetical protein M2172_000001, partial [Bradyrhizobium elkanii]|nr:hypothetical protein [Bradyrhizobium elkanii]